MTENSTGLDASVAFLIDRLIENKSYPKYQFERASEVFLAPFIAEWLGKQLGDQSLELVAMEFPLKKESNNQSTNADYLLYSAAPEPFWWLAEIKTEVGELPPRQIEAYRTAIHSLGVPRAPIRTPLSAQIS